MWPEEQMRKEAGKSRTALKEGKAGSGSYDIWRAGRKGAEI